VQLKHCLDELGSVGDCLQQLGVLSNTSGTDASGPSGSGTVAAATPAAATGSPTQADAYTTVLAACAAAQNGTGSAGVLVDCSSLAGQFPSGGTVSNPQQFLACVLGGLKAIAQTGGAPGNGNADVNFLQSAIASTCGALIATPS
jgi:hypothetical protein